MKKQRIVTLMATAAIVSSLTAGSAFAFEDVDQADQKQPIQALQDRGVVSGMDSLHFMPREKITYAQSMVMLVKGLQLNIDSLQFFKKPEASDYFTRISNDAWYAQAFVIAQLNGLPIPKDVDPNGTITREQFADLLIHALNTKGTFPIVKMLVLLADKDEIDPNLNGSVQALILHQIEKLGEDRKIYPKRELTRGEAAVWVYNTIRFLESHNALANPDSQENVTMTVERVNDDVNKIILSRGQKPTTGYGIDVQSIRFETDGTAVISYRTSDPAPGSINGQMITEPKAETYVSSKYKPVLEQAKDK
ncbi:protease complex subunit PrcB family protein [Paenibacillus filicis]|uniref:Protease complex subunit PrcB family protein n=1 Tax=Paenibacillus gyeongsangnamensis TaxID=3388067 RepID=A0ABT4Q7D3_9BACL|nr:protease complex subunit PrcB family protein [Paenibacillus filicis]MCZ8512779.1 protease complex subunit PrcB family protein [Paenibacillus filicis]